MVHAEKSFFHMEILRYFLFFWFFLYILPYTYNIYCMFCLFYILATFYVDILWNYFGCAILFWPSDNNEKQCSHFTYIYNIIFRRNNFTVKFQNTVQCSDSVQNAYHTFGFYEIFWSKSNFVAIPNAYFILLF